MSATDIRSRLLDDYHALYTLRDSMTRTTPRLGQPRPTDHASLDYHAASLALDHIQEAVNVLSTIGMADAAEDWQ